MGYARGRAHNAELGGGIGTAGQEEATAEHSF